MKNLSRSAFALAFAAALFFAPAVHAAPPHRAHATPASSSLAARLSSAWTQLTHFFASTTTTTQGKGPTSSDGGSCVDPNGCQAQLFRH